MGRSRETFGKKEIRNKQAKKRKEKEKRRQEKKEQGKKDKFDDMIAWVDEKGQITSSPPDLSSNTEVDPESIEVGVPKKVSSENDKISEGKVISFDESKAYGFIKILSSNNNIFVHINDCKDDIREGDKVQFETERGDRGLKAINVRRVS